MLVNDLNFYPDAAKVLKLLLTCKKCITHYYTFIQNPQDGKDRYQSLILLFLHLQLTINELQQKIPH